MSQTLFGIYKPCIEYKSKVTDEKTTVSVDTRSPKYLRNFLQFGCPGDSKGFGAKLRTRRTKECHDSGKRSLWNTFLREQRGWLTLSHFVGFFHKMSRDLYIKC